MEWFNKKKITFVIAIVMAIILCGCGKEEEPVEEMTSVQDESATDKTKGWFLNAAEKYAEEDLGISECKVYGSIYNVLDGITADNALLNASADMSIYLKAEDVGDADIAEFSDNFARKLATDGASGNVKCSVYVVPESVYSQIEEGNHTQIEEKSKEIDNYQRYGFNYSGIGVSQIELQTE